MIQWKGNRGGSPANPRWVTALRRVCVWTHSCRAAHQPRLTPRWQNLPLLSKRVSHQAPLWSRWADFCLHLLAEQLRISPHRVWRFCVLAQLNLERGEDRNGCRLWKKPYWIGDYSVIGPRGRVVGSKGWHPTQLIDGATPLDRCKVFVFILTKVWIPQRHNHLQKGQIVFSERWVCERCKFISKTKRPCVKGKSICLVHRFLNDFCAITQGPSRPSTYTG